MKKLEITIHSVREDGLPPEGTPGVAFIFDGCLVSGWPLRGTADDDHLPAWEADSDVGRKGRFVGVTHWVEFPVSLVEVERA